uniref:Uncharacterized protein n=1 Tax=Arundo donax TaxID=35708 RepID=A0A0A9CGK8_ARUDO
MTLPKLKETTATATEQLTACRIYQHPLYVSDRS